MNFLSSTLKRGNQIKYTSNIQTVSRDADATQWESKDMKRMHKGGTGKCAVKLKFHLRTIIIYVKHSCPKRNQSNSRWGNFCMRH